MALFWKKLIESRPELIGTTVYFSPTQKSTLPCIINDDGTISPSTAPNQRFASIGNLISSWKNGDITNESGLKLSKKVRGKFSFDKDFFFGTKRQQMVKNLFRPNSIVAVLAERENKPTQETIYQENTNEPLTDPFVPGRVQCPGFDRRRHQLVIEKRKWDTTRAEFSPVKLEGDRCWSTKCKGYLVGCQKICWDCKKAKQLLYRRRAAAAKPTMWYTEEVRIAHTPTRFLTNAEKIQKKEYQLTTARLLLKKKKKECRSLKRTIERYRPKNEKSRIAVQKIVQTINRDQQKIQSPICQWTIDENVCGFEASSINGLLQHISERHYLPQMEANEERSLFEKEYFCMWHRCSRLASFEKLEYLRKHVAWHTGNNNTENKLLFLHEQMTNSSRAAHGRRYGEKTRQAILQQYNSRQSYERYRKISAFPLPTARTIIAWKNTGRVTSGIDWTILSLMAKIRRAAPELRHGILVFDEIYVNPKIELQSKSGQEFGWADNAEKQLAKTVLVFQFSALFSKKRFAVNIAWFGCGVRAALNTETLECWLFDVLLALERYGFRAHAIVCDGHEVNRSLQKRLVENSKKAGCDLDSDFVIVHPMTSTPDARLFLLSDPSHVIKRWRNCLYNRHMAFRAGSTNPNNPGCLLDHELIKWDDVLKVQEWQSKYPRVDRRLTQKHTDLENSYRKMDVMTAVDTVSDAVEAVMIDIDAFATTGTRYYMSMGRDLWQRANDHKIYRKGSDTEAYFAGLSSVAEQLLSWREGTLDSPGRFLTTETFEDAMLLCRGLPAFMQYIWDVLSKEVPNAGFRPSVLSQDGLESTFGYLRVKGGGTQNITVYSLAFNLRTKNCNIINEFFQLLKIE